MEMSELKSMRYGYPLSDIYPPTKKQLPGSNIQTAAWLCSYYNVAGMLVLVARVLGEFVIDITIALRNREDALRGIL